MHGFEFERLRVFDAAADAATDINSLARRIPLMHRSMRDQVSRSSISVPLNIAEGADEYSVAEKVRFYRMARRSAAESAAALILLVRLGAFLPNEIERAMALLNRTAAMLTSMMTTLEARRPGSQRRRQSTQPTARNPTGPSAVAVSAPAQRPGPGPGPGPASPQ